MRPWHGRVLALPAAVFLSAAVLAGCGSSSHPNGATLVLYNGQHEQTTNELVAGFEAATGINVVVRNNDEDIFDSEIVAEGKNCPADIFYTENSPALEYLQEKGLLAAVDPSTLAHTPSRFNSPQGDWVGVSARVSVIIYNPSLISASQLPTHVIQMSEPRYAGKIAIAAGETDFQPIVTAMVRQYGTASTLTWLQGLKANAGSHVYPDNETIADEVNRGVVAFGIVNQYYWYRLRAEVGASNVQSKITYFAPGDPGYVVDVSGAAVLKTSKHQALAQRFLAFLVSKEGQEIINHSISFEYPIASGVTGTQGETPFQDLRPYPITIAELGTGQEAIALLREVQLL